VSRRWTTVAVTGAGGRLGTALLATLAADPGVSVLRWRRPELDLDDPASSARLVARDRPSLVIHAAAWTDVDGCAREPDLAMRRNAETTGALARACAGAGVRLVVVSTNEVFDGHRTDGHGYREDDPAQPRNPYGRSKLAGETAARAAFDSGAGLWIVRVAWLYGPPGNDFPAKILVAADRLPQGEALPVVSDETGNPTWTDDLAAAIIALTERTAGGTWHLPATGRATRLEWADAVLARLRPERPTRPISRSAFTRASDSPPWGVLDGSLAAGSGILLPDWRSSLQRYLDADPPDERPDR